MSFGLPVQQAPESVARSLAEALHASAITCLVVAAIAAAAFQPTPAAVVAWPALLVLLPMALALFAVSRVRTPLYSVAYLVVGGATVYGYTLTFTSQFDLGDISETFSVAPAMMALVLLGGAGTAAGALLSWCTAGFVVAESASALAVIHSGGPFRVDTATLVGFLATVLLIALAGSSGRGGMRANPELHRVAREEISLTLRRKAELRAAALLHDTILNDLAAVGAERSGALQPALKDRLERDLALFTTGDWLREPRALDAGGDWRESSVLHAVRDVAELGLEIDTTGDPSVLSALDGVTDGALGSAVRQCLVNVLNHSGRTDAELAIHGAGDEVLVMVIDTGNGFDTDHVAPDRLGLKTSVRGRVEAAGGSVQVWSTVGRGTSVVIRVPVALHVGAALDTHGTGGDAL